MKILMFGWEFPPFKSGGLGTACYGLTKGLNHLGIQVVFVIPTAPYEIKSKYVELVVANKFATEKKKIKPEIFFGPYLSFGFDSTSTNYRAGSPNYSANIFEEVERYAKLAPLIAKSFDFDIIHAHDWMCGKAGLEAARATGKPFIFQIHATEIDRTAGFPNPRIYQMEKEIMEAADLVIAVSNFTKNIITKNYGIPKEKVEVVYNAVEHQENPLLFRGKSHNLPDKIVLYLGRITVQKGPSYFLKAAKRVLEYYPNVKFVLAGTGDLWHSMIEKAAQMGIIKNVFFTGFLRGKEVDTAFRMADLYVMPSVSEPFGITALEAMRNGTPCIISKQSGVSEVVKNCLKVDFWDIDELVNKIIGVLSYKKLGEEMRSRALEEVSRISWIDSANELKSIYERFG